MTGTASLRTPPPLRGPTLGEIGYVGGVAALTVVLLTLVSARALPYEAVLLLVLPLGPLGLPAAVLLLVGSAFIGGVDSALGWVVGDGAVLVTALVLAVANVAIARRIRQDAARRPRPEAFHGRLPFGLDRLLGSSAFVLAGTLHILLWVLSGFTAMTAHGVDVRAPEARAALDQLVAGGAFVLGLAAAVGGLVLLIVGLAQGRALLRRASAALAVQLALVTVLVVLVQTR